MKSNMISGLIRPTAFPHSVEYVHLIETHISWLLLTGEFVYKIKKPVDLGFLDFSSLEQRKYYCEEELRLNQRYAPELYLDVVAIRGSEHSPQLGGDGEIIDYAVKMREFDQSCLLDHIVEEQGIDLGLVKKIADKIAQFHHQISTLTPSDSIENKYGGIESIREVAEQNFIQIAPLAQNLMNYPQLLNLQKWTDDALLCLEPKLVARKSQGFIRECHGDLHLGNIALIDGEVCLFDCIEFSKAFRFIDTICEISFVIMDLEYRDKIPQANYLLNCYLEQCGDFSGLAVLKFYKVYLAVVRAKVSLFKAQDCEEADVAERCLDSFYRYLELAERYTRPSVAFLMITHGVSGTGKSTVASRIAGILDAIRVRSDVERKRLYGLKDFEKSNSAQGQGIYTEQATNASFERLECLASEVIASGFPCIIDATFITSSLRDQFFRLAEKLGVPFRILDCRASDEEIRRRLALREEAGKDVSEAGIEIMETQLGRRDPLSTEEMKYTVAIDTELDMSNNGWKRQLISDLGIEEVTAYFGES